jgi:hypothetical protein
MLFGVPVMVMASGWAYIAATGWCLFVMNWLVGNSGGHILPQILWAYGSSMTSLSAPLVKNPWARQGDETQTDTSIMMVIAAFASEAGCVAMLAGILLFNVKPTVSRLLPILPPFLAALIFAEVAFSLVVATAWSRSLRLGNGRDRGNAI